MEVKEIIKDSDDGEKRYQIVQYQKAMLADGTFVDVVDNEASEIVIRSRLLIELTSASMLVNLIQEKIDAIDKLQKE